MTVHSSVWIDAPRSALMLGSATFTTRLSRTIMNSPIDTITRVQALRAVFVVGDMAIGSLLVSANYI